MVKLAGTPLTTVPETSDKRGPAFDKEKKEVELNGLAIDRLKEIAAQNKVSASGDKASIIRNIIDKMMGESKTATYCVLKEAIISSTAKIQRDYLKKV